MIKRVLSLSLLFTLVIAASAFAQQNFQGVNVVDNIDFESMNISQLSDSQIASVSRQLERSGMAIEDMEQLAVLRGMTPQDARALVTRIRTYRQATGGASTEDQLDTTRLDDLRALTEFYDTSPFAALAAASDTIPDSLRVFGMDHFREVATSFEPSMNIPTPVNYQLGPGDEILIDIWGASNGSHQLVISPEGSILIPNIGPVRLSGMTVEEARERILTRLTSIHSGLNPDNQSAGTVFAEINLGNIKSIMVPVFGEVRQPGVYTVSSLARAFNLLYAAGGPTESGTFRDIKVLRGDSVIASIDLYDMILDGDSSDDVPLRNGDFISVGTYKNRVYVSGESKRVGYFELLDGETFADFERYFGGFTPDAYTESFYVERTTSSRRRALTIEYPEEVDTILQHGDKVRVRRVTERFENRVTTRGAFVRTGNYEWEPGMTLYELIRISDGLKEEASRERGTITRLNETRESVVIPFNPGLVLENPEVYDVPLRPDDVVNVLTIFDLRENYTITISGPVNRPGEYPFRENMTVEDAIYGAYGFRDDAATYNIDVARRVTEGGTVKQDIIADRVFFTVDEDLTVEPVNPADSVFYLKPFDRIYVRGLPNYQSQMTVEIVGEVQVPGEYTLANRQARISDLVEWAEGPSEYANIEGARLFRRIADAPRQPRADLAQRQTAQAAQTSQAGGTGGTGTQGTGGGTGQNNNMNGVLVDTLSTIPRSPVAIRLREILANPGGPGDLVLLPDDRLEIPTFQQTVEISGEVNRPVNVRFQNGQSLSHYVDEAGGLTEEARRSKAYVIYANGEVSRAKKFLFFRNDPEVRPGAEIVIPTKPARDRLSTQEIIAISSSIASTALLFVTLIDRIQN